MSTSREIAKLISRDVAMTAKLLMIVNSAFFGLPRRVTSIESAINYLGTTMLRSVILATAANTSLGPRAKKLGYDFDAQETHGLLSANLAMQFFTDKNAREDAFAASLLQNVGELLLIAAAPDEALTAIKRAREASLPLQEVERELGVVSHAAMGAYLLGAWGLPYSIVEAVAQHHEPWDVPHDALDVVDAVHVATLVADHYLLSRADSLERAGAHLRTTAEHWLQQSAESST
jgi:HD-like signal output (HDOD) protein